MKKAIVAAAVGALVIISGQVMAADKGEETYKKVCFACHQNGIAGAPKMGDKASWAPRVAQGMATLQTHAIKGYNGKTGMMPAKGGNPAIPDADVKAAVEYMVKNSK